MPASSSALLFSSRNSLLGHGSTISFLETKHVNESIKLEQASCILLFFNRCLGSHQTGILFLPRTAWTESRTSAKCCHLTNIEDGNNDEGNVIIATAFEARSMLFRACRNANISQSWIYITTTCWGSLLRTSAEIVTMVKQKKIMEAEQRDHW